jgi:hypothetical protein
MPTHDMLDAVARELAVLPSGDRRAILQAFDAGDRDRLRAAMRGSRSAMTGTNATSRSRHSAWVENLIEGAGSAADDRMTGATRAALLEAVGQPQTGTARPAGRSLLQAAGGLLGQKMSR